MTTNLYPIDDILALPVDADGWRRHPDGARFYIGARSRIGAGCIIGASSYIGASSTIGDDCRIPIDYFSRM